MNLNSALKVLYSERKSVYQYHQELFIYEDTLYNYKFNKDFIDIFIPDISEIIIISGINSDFKYDIIADKNIIKNNCIFTKKYKEIFIRLYIFNSLKKDCLLSFDVILAKKSIISCL